MKSFWFFVICGCVAQVYTGETIRKYIRDRPGSNGADYHIDRYELKFAKIQGIRPAVVDEIRDITNEFCQNDAVIGFVEELDEILRKELHVDIHTLSVDEVKAFFDVLKKEKPLYKTNDNIQVVAELGEIFSKFLPLDQASHMKSLFGILEGTSGKIQDGLKYLYGDTATIQR